MSKAIFLFISSLMLMLPVAMLKSLSISDQLLLSAPFIFFLGIPHGAIDNILYLKKSGVGQSIFFTIYLLLICANTIIWVLFPPLAYLSFLLLSAYHFGQSQFSHYFKKQSYLNVSLYFTWGISIVSGLIFFNQGFLIEAMTSDLNLAELSSLHLAPFNIIFWVSTLLTAFQIILLGIRKELSRSALFMELLVFILILMAFFLLPLIIGFTLYFVILHSFKVMNEEYYFLKTEGNINSSAGFIRMIAPFTILSLIGVSILILSINKGWIQLSYGHALLILISSITFPHVFVMNRFYRNIFSKAL